VTGKAIIMFAFGDPSRTPIICRMLISMPTGATIGTSNIYAEAVTTISTSFGVIDLHIIDEN
jgi:hypothetical protein